MIFKLYKVIYRIKIEKHALCFRHKALMYLRTYRLSMTSLSAAALDLSDAAARVMISWAL